MRSATRLIYATAVGLLSVGAAPVTPPVATIGMDFLWRSGRYEAAELAALAAPTDPLSKLVLAKADSFAGQYLESQRLGTNAASNLTGDNKREALDVAARAAFLRGDNVNASRLGRLACAGVVGWPQSWEGADLFCKRFPSGFLTQLGGFRFPRELTAKHATPFLGSRPTVAASFGAYSSSAFLDTGSEASVIEARDAANLGVKITEYTTRVTGFTDQPLTVKLGVLPKAQLAGWELRQLPVIVLPDVFPVGALPSPFILGVNELTPFRASFDWQARLFTLTAHQSSPSAVGSRVLTGRGAGLAGPNLRAKLTVGGKALWITPDTGSTRLLLSRASLQRAGINVPGSGGGSAVAGVTGNLDVTESALQSPFTLLGKTFPSAAFGLAPSLPEGADGIAGTELIFSGRLIIDLQSALASIE